MFIRLGWLLLLALSLQAQSATYYTSPTGDDNATGAQTAPWRTINRSVGSLKPGDTLNVSPGVYAELVGVWPSGTQTAPITIAGTQVIIDGSTLSPVAWESLFEVFGAYVNISGFELRNMNLSGAVVGGYGLSLDGVGDTASNMSVHDIWSAGMYSQNDDQTISNSSVYRVALSNCRLSSNAECGVSTNAVTAKGDWPGCVSIIRGFGTGLINHNSTISNVTVYDCWGEGISTYNSQYATIINNTSYNNFSENIYVDNAQFATISGNTIYNYPDAYLGAYQPNAGGVALADEQNNNPASNLSHGNIVTDNLIMNASVSLYAWTLVSGTGLVNDEIVNNTLVNSNLSTGYAGTQNITNGGSFIAGNTVYGGVVTIPSSEGITFFGNTWLTAIPSTVSNN